jgi:g-D-glutamyl-meso-diaminopimelate peptidase
MYCPQIIMPRKGYGYEEMVNDISLLEERYPELETQEIGHSVTGRKIIALRLGKGSKEIFYSASMHANEWINTILMMMYTEVYFEALNNFGCLGSYNVSDLFESISLWIVPMVNPDGVELVQRGIDLSSPYYYDVMKINQWSKNFSQWKANIRGVDLNDQFPAGWEIERARRDVPGPSPLNYPGEYPLSEPRQRLWPNSPIITIFV